MNIHILMMFISLCMNECEDHGHAFIHKEMNIHILMMFCSSIDRGSQQSKWLVIILFSLGM